MGLSHVRAGSCLMVLVVWATTADAEAMAGGTAVMRARSMLPSGRRKVRGLSRWTALTSCGSAPRPIASAPAVMPRMVFSGSPPEGNAAAKAHTGPEVSWLAWWAWLARSVAVARAAGQLPAESWDPSVWVSCVIWLSWLRAIKAVTVTHRIARRSTPPTVIMANPMRLRRRHARSEMFTGVASDIAHVFSHAGLAYWLALNV